MDQKFSTKYPSKIKVFSVHNPDTFYELDFITPEKQRNWQSKILVILKRNAKERKPSSSITGFNSFRSTSRDSTSSGISGYDDPKRSCRTSGSISGYDDPRRPSKGSTSSSISDFPDFRKPGSTSGESGFPDSMRCTRGSTISSGIPDSILQHRGSTSDDVSGFPDSRSRLRSSTSSFDKRWSNSGDFIGKNFPPSTEV